MTTAVGPEFLPPEPTDWHAYRKCPVDGAPTGTPCFTLSGTVAGGRPDGKVVLLAVAHTTRPLRTNYRPATSTPPGSA